jgi:replicative DNA helicase
MKLYDLDQERILLAGMISYTDFYYSEIDAFISEEDLYSKESIVNKTIYLKINALAEDRKKIDYALLLHHLNSLNLSFQDKMTTSGYLSGLDNLSQTITEDALKQAAEVVKLLSIRREMVKMGDNLSKTVRSLDSTASYQDIIDSCDKIYNEKVELYERESRKAVNLFEIMPDLVYERANDRSIFKDSGPMGPHESLNNLCGSLTKGGQIAIVCAGSGVGKTQFTTHYCMNIAGKHRIPVLHLDNGEMSEEEIVFRMLASYSRVPLHLIESGDWADDSDCKSRVESALEKIKSGEINYDYYNVGGKTIDDMISYIKRYYYSKIGRGNKLIINFDYIKSSFESGNKFKPEHQVIGEMLDKLKKLIQRDLCYEGRPQVSLMTGVQMNRQGTVGNRNSSAVVDDESVIAGSHRIKFYCTHLLILRHKTVDELQWDPTFCGRHLMKIEKGRSFGADYARAENLVVLPDGTQKKNYINFEFDNFKIIDRGDLVDSVSSMEDINNLEVNTSPDGVPDL